MKNKIYQKNLTLDFATIAHLEEVKEQLGVSSSEFVKKAVKELYDKWVFLGTIKRQMSTWERIETNRIIKKLNEGQTHKK